MKATKKKDETRRKRSRNETETNGNGPFNKNKKTKNKTRTQQMMQFQPVAQSTTFTCEGKVFGGYYADVESGCQMFHVCTLGQKGTSFLGLPCFNLFLIFLFYFFSWVLLLIYRVDFLLCWAILS